MTHAYDVDAELEPAIACRIQPEPVDRVEREMVDPVRQAQAARDRRVEVGPAVVVQLHEREELTVADVVEGVAQPATRLSARRPFDVDQLESHRLGVEAVRGLEIPGRQGEMVEAHGMPFPVTAVTRNN